MATPLYEQIGTKYCKDYIYLNGETSPEYYPDRLDPTDPLSSTDAALECRNRCVDAANTYPDISGLAFYVENPDSGSWASAQLCGCSSGSCPSGNGSPGDYYRYKVLTPSPTATPTEVGQIF